MRILCLVIPHFPAGIERRDKPALRGRLLLIVKDGQVMDCSPGALDQGIRVGMKIEGAEKLCPEALVLAADITRYEGAFQGVLKVLAAVSPVVETVTWGEAYSDISGQSSRFGDETTLCREVGRRLYEETALQGKLGVAGNKFTSYVAAHTTGEGQTLLIPPDTEQEFLAPLPADLLPLSQEMREELRLLGIRSMGQFARLPAKAVLARFGPQGQKAHRLARGQEGQPLIPCHSPQVVEARLEFEPPLEMNGVLAQAVEELVDTCCLRLRKRGQTCQEIHLILSFEDGSSRGVQRTLSGPTADPRIVEAGAQELIRSLSCSSRVIEVCLVLARLQAQRGKQLSLEVISSPAKVDLAHLVGPLVARFGADRFYSGRVASPSCPMTERRFAWQRWAQGNITSLAGMLRGKYDATLD